DMAESLLVSSVLTFVGGVTLAVPLPEGVESLGAPQIAGAGALVLLMVLATRGGPHRRAEVAAFLAVVALALTIAAVAFGYGWSSW
ncbi:type VII secretion integral membrane protein EccD, partial [Mycobacterium sp. ITM-2017-0098]